MSSLYLALNIGSIAIPFLASFHPRLKFYKRWKYLLFSILITSLIFIVWDIYFTENGVWGFNENYLIGIYLFGLPLEEWLFFLCIPYACIFSHYAILELAPNLKLSDKIVKVITGLVLLAFLLLTIFNYSKLYTLFNYALAFIVLLLTYIFKPELLKNYFLTFLFMLVPFFLINGILTGSFIENEVVWYNNLENLGIRIGTIPFEDITYAFTLILLSLFLMNTFDKKH